MSDVCNKLCLNEKGTDSTIVLVTIPVMSKRSQPSLQTLYASSMIGCPNYFLCHCVLLILEINRAVFSNTLCICNNTALYKGLIGIHTTFDLFILILSKFIFNFP